MGATLNIMKKDGRSSFRPTRRYKFSKTNHSFSYNKPRAKGSVTHLFDKYNKLAKEASSTGDRIQAEYYHQFADHYSRIMIENGIKSSDNEIISEDSNKKNIEISNIENNQEISKSSTDHNIKFSEKTEIEDKIDENDNSLETVSFISQPANKTEKLKK